MNGDGGFSVDLGELGSIDLSAEDVADLEGAVSEEPDLAEAISAASAFHSDSPTTGYNIGLVNSMMQDPTPASLLSGLRAAYTLGNEQLGVIGRGALTASSVALSPLAAVGLGLLAPTTVGLASALSEAGGSTGGSTGGATGGAGETGFEAPGDVFRQLRMRMAGANPEYAKLLDRYGNAYASLMSLLGSHLRRQKNSGVYRYAG